MAAIVVAALGQSLIERPGDLLVTDFSMRGPQSRDCDGLPLLLTLRRQLPALPIIVLTARDIPGDLPDAALWRALAVAAGGRLDDEGGSHWRLRLPYGPTSAMPADPA